MLPFSSSHLGLGGRGCISFSLLALKATQEVEERAEQHIKRGEASFWKRG